MRQLSRIQFAMIAMTGRVTMLGISRWAGKGGSYRTIQRFFYQPIPWTLFLGKFFQQHLFQPGGTYIMAGDESVITKSGSQTFGLDRFFSGTLGIPVKSIAIFALSLIHVEKRRSYPTMVQQVVRSEAEKEAAKARTKKRKANKHEPATAKRKPGRPKGSKNRDKTKVELTPELSRLEQMLKSQLAVIRDFISITYLALDGHFGNHNALQVVLRCNLQLISKLRHDTALYFPYDEPYKGKGPHPKYGDRVDFEHIPDQYLVETRMEDHIEVRIYQAKLLHKAFSQPLNVVILTKRNLKNGKFANVNLFSSDLDLVYDVLIDYYRLRFQIEFNFRDAKQYWGLEDFMNIKELPVSNMLNLPLFMVNLSQVLLQQFSQDPSEHASVLDLKAYFRASKYFQEMIKMFPKNPEPILFEQIFGNIASLGSIHNVNVQLSPT
jgi:putative transposase